jgi:hypothetical protein
MATTNLAMTLPTVGGSTNAWGGTLNTNLDIIDAVFATAGTGTSVGLNIGSGKTLSVAGALSVTGTVTLPTTTNITNTTFNISSITGNGNTATVTFNSSDIIVAGTQITIAGVTGGSPPNGFNGTFTSTTSSPGVVSYTLTGVTGTVTSTGTIYYPLTIVTTSGTQTITGKTFQDIALAGNVTGTYSLLGTPTLASNLTSLGDITFTKNTPVITLDNSGSTFGYRFQAAVTSTDGGFFLQQRSGVSWDTALTVASNRAIIVGGATGGSVGGVGTVNATGYYVNGSLQPINRGYASTGTINMTVNQTITLSHGMAVLPEIVTFTLTCTDAGGDAGYAPNDQIMIPLNNGQTYSSNSYGYSTQISSTQIIIRVVNGAGPLVIVNKSTKALAGLNESKWSLLVRAYA